MTDFLLELRSEEIPARMQAKAREDLAKLFVAELSKAGLTASDVTTYATPRRLALIARDLPDATEAVSEEVKGPKASAPPQALEGFLRKTGLTRDQLIERNGILFAVTEKPGRATADVLAEAIPAIIRAFPWPKSMRWGAASTLTESLRWVRPLQGIVALFGDAIVPVEIAGITSGAATLGHRFHHPGMITIGGAHDYVEKLRACHVIVDQGERAALIRDRAQALAAEAGLELVEDEGLVAENAGLTEWPVPLLGRFDEAFLQVPPEVIQLTARVNQRYFVCTPPRNGEGDRREAGVEGHPPQANRLANAFICTANIDASDGGAKIVDGNRKVLAARLSDARFFYETDLKVPLDEQARKLEKIVFHEKLGTVADKVERVAKLARWLVEEGIVAGAMPSPSTNLRRPREGGDPSPALRNGTAGAMETDDGRWAPAYAGATGESGPTLADLVERAARLCKADLVTGMVGEFPELQGLMGGYYALAQGEDPQVAEAIRDHYKPVGQGDDVPTAPVTVAVSLADKLDNLLGFFARAERPTGSKDPFALRRAALSIISLIQRNNLRLELDDLSDWVGMYFVYDYEDGRDWRVDLLIGRLSLKDKNFSSSEEDGKLVYRHGADVLLTLESPTDAPDPSDVVWDGYHDFMSFIVERVKVQQRIAGIRHDIVDASAALWTLKSQFTGEFEVETDLVRLLARVRALQAFVGTEDGANLLAGYKRAANILKKEGWTSPLPLTGGAVRGADGGGPVVPAAESVPPRPSATPPAGGRGENALSYTPEPCEAALHTALDSAEPAAASAVAAEDFEGAMAALASLRAPIDAFFETVTVNDPAAEKRQARLALLARVRGAVHTVADFSRIEG